MGEADALGRLAAIPDCSSGMVIQSAMASNIETEISAPSPLRPRAISASRIAS